MPMQKVFRKVAAVIALGAVFAYVNPLPAADGAAPPAADSAAPTPLSMDELKKSMKPLERVEMAAKGTLKNPYTDNAEAIEQGKKLYFNKSCNGCHGGGGGGGMCPPLTNSVWVYGSDDDTLFRLISMGTDDLKKHGYSRKGTEGVVGPMPPFGTLIDSDQDLWKIIAWIRTVYSGPPAKRNW